MANFIYKLSYFKICQIKDYSSIMNKKIIYIKVHVTLDMCTPRDLWIPEHSMQTKIPKFITAQSGLLLPQSAHEEFAD